MIGFHLSFGTFNHLPALLKFSNLPKPTFQHFSTILFVHNSRNSELGTLEWKCRYRTSYSSSQRWLARG
jgi:hypothetical protein